MQLSNLLGHFGNDSLGGGKLVLCGWTLTRKVESLTLHQKGRVTYTRHSALESIVTSVVHTYLSLPPDRMGARTNLVCMGMYQTLPFSENLAT